MLSAVFGVAAFFAAGFLKKAFHQISSSGERRATVEDRLRQYGPAVDARRAPLFRSKNISYPPQKLVFVGFKLEKNGDIAAQEIKDNWDAITKFPGA